MSASSCDNGTGYILADRAQPLAAYPHMREANGFLFVSGISSRRPDGTVDGVQTRDGAVITDIRAQTRAVIENIKTILGAAGAGLENIVTLTAYLVDMGEYGGYNAVYNEYFTAERGPSRTTIGVASLPGPHLRIEITAVAKAPNQTAAAPAPSLDARLQPLADRLFEAQATSTPCDPLSESLPDLTVAEAYAIARANLTRSGSRQVGWKVGLTSTAVQTWLGVSEPDFGGLTEAMSVNDGDRIDIASLLQPRVEGEVAFVLARDLPGPVVSDADVMAATAFVVPCIEVIDSRVRDWKITLVDTVADNASSARFVLGRRQRRLEDLDLRMAGMALRRNGDVVSTGAGAACLDHPVKAVRWLAEKLASLGHMLHAGDVVLSGALGPVCPVSSGDHIEVEISGLGTVSARF